MQRWCRLPFEVAAWLLEHGPCDRGETRECTCWLLALNFKCSELVRASRAACEPTSLPSLSAVLDLGNLWLEQQHQAVTHEQQTALAALVWRLPVAADFLRCVAANLPWAADYVASSPQRPASLPPSLDGRFSFTAEVSCEHCAVWMFVT